MIENPNTTILDKRWLIDYSMAECPCGKHDDVKYWEHYNHSMQKHYGDKSHGHKSQHAGHSYQLGYHTSPLPVNCWRTSTPMPEIPPQHLCQPNRKHADETCLAFDGAQMGKAHRNKWESRSKVHDCKSNCNKGIRLVSRVARPWTDSSTS